jgi:hypothetical protein
MVWKSCCSSFHAYDKKGWMYPKIIVLVAKMCLKMDGTWQILGFSHFCLFKEFRKVMGIIPFRWYC